MENNPYPNSNQNSYGSYQGPNPNNTQQALYAQQQPYPQYQPSSPAAVPNYVIPEEYKPISAWGYVGYNLLFAIPLAGFILILVFSFGGNNNKNVRNYARSQMIVWLIEIIIIVILLSTGVFAAIFHQR